MTNSSAPSAPNDAVRCSAEQPLSAHLPASVDRSIPTIESAIEPGNEVAGDPYIRLSLDGRTMAAVSTDQAQEVMVIPRHRLTVMPNMSTAAMGLLNHRSRIFWVLDLPQLFGLPPLDPRSQEYHLVILRINDQAVGLAVQSVLGVTRFSTAEIQSPLDHDITPGLVPYLKGCLPKAEELLLVLDAEVVAAYSG